MKKEFTKRMLISIAFSVIISLFIWMFTAVILKKLDCIAKFISDNQYFINYMKRISERKIIYPFEILFCITILNFLFFMFIKKNKIIFIILIVIVSLTGFVSFVIMTKMGDEFVFQLIESLMDVMNHFNQFN